MTQPQFDFVIKNIPAIEPTLEDGYQKVEDFLITVGEFSIVTSFELTKQTSEEKGDHFTPPFFESDLTVHDLNYEVYNTEGDEISLTEEQLKSLISKLERSIICC